MSSQDPGTEFSEDAKHIFAIVCINNQHFKIHWDNLRADFSIDYIINSISSTIRHLRSSDRVEQLPMAVDFTCAILNQWLVVYYCKKMLQLMTPEALVTQGRSMYRHYFKTYLKRQVHFSLRKMTSTVFKAMQLE